MKKFIVKTTLLASLGILILPSTLLAQTETVKDKKETKERQTIVINRESGTEGKTVIEIDGDKVKINGKDAKDMKDVHVTVNTNRGNNVWRMNGNGNTYSFNMDDNAFSLFNEDSNRGMLGVMTEDDDKGAEIVSITDESGADKAGLKKGDIITRIEGKKIEKADDVAEAVKGRKPGDKLDVTYLRSGKEQKSAVTLSKWKGIRMNSMVMPRTYTPMPPINVEGFSGTFAYGRPRLGVSVQDTDDGKGAKVLEVDEDGTAAKAGLKKDDIILSVDDKEIKGADDVSRAMRTRTDKYTYNMKVQRGTTVQNIEVKIPRKLKTADL